MPVLHAPTAALQVDTPPLTWMIHAGTTPQQTNNIPRPRRWLISERGDFWFASAGASCGLLAALGLIVFYGDRELDWLDLVLSELHLGATYDAIIRRRLWWRRPADVLMVPLVILAATYALIARGHWLFINYIVMFGVF